MIFLRFVDMDLALQIGCKKQGYTNQECMLIVFKGLTKVSRKCCHFSLAYQL